MRVVKIVLLLWCVLLPMQVKASEVEDRLNSSYDFSELDEMLLHLFPEEKMSFKDVVLSLVSGEKELSVELIADFIKDQFTYEWRNSKNSIIQILVLVIIAAVFTNISGVFQSTQAAEVSFSILYMLLITVCLQNFRILADAAGTHVEQMMEFMRLLGPVYFMAVAVATGSGTSVTFYQLVLVLIFLVELLIRSFLLPMTQIYLVIRILDEYAPQIRLSKAAELLETLISWTLKTLTAGIIGLNVIQGLLAPAMDTVKRSLVMKGSEAIPIVGDAIGGAAEVGVAAAVLIKNGIGVTGMLICMIVCLTPMIQIAVTSLLYRLIAALLQPVSDKRMVNCISSVADGSRMLLKVVFTTGLLFFITIAVVATTTGG